MRATAIRCLVLLLGLLLGAGCAGGPRIHVDATVRLDRYASWDWIPGSGRTIDAPAGDARALDRELARRVEDELGERGWVREAQGADLRLGAVLDVRREVVTVLETAAMHQLSSLHESGSFQVQSMVERKQVYEHSRLVLYAIDPRRGRVVWRGTLEQRFPGTFSPHVGDVVSALLERFPRAGAPGRGPEKRRDPPGDGETLLSRVGLRPEARAHDGGGGVPVQEGPRIGASRIVESGGGDRG